jgi:hypothetical protein
MSNIKDCSKLSTNELIALNKGEITHEDIYKKMQACNSSIGLNNAKAKQAFVVDSLRNKDSKNFNELFKQIHKLRSSGALAAYAKAYGPESLLGTGKLKKLVNENNVFDGAEHKINTLLEKVGTSVGAPIAPMVSTPYSGNKPQHIINKYPGKTTQDVGSGQRKKESK